MLSGSSRVFHTPEYYFLFVFIAIPPLAPGGIILKTGQFIGLVRKIGKDYRLSLDLYAYTVYTNIQVRRYILCITKQDNTEVLLVYIGNQHLYIRTSNIEIKYPTELTPRKWTNIQISQTNTDAGYKLALSVNGMKVEWVNTNPERFENLKVYASNAGYTNQQGVIQNLYINGK